MAAPIADHVVFMNSDGRILSQGPPVLIKDDLPSSSEKEATSEEQPIEEPKDVKTSLGFVPAPETKNTLLKARKSKGKKNMLRGVDAG